MDADESRIYSPEEKCIYYHNNHTRIFTSVYEGIPENLLLNFMGWLVSKIFNCFERFLIEIYLFVSY